MASPTPSRPLTIAPYSSHHAPRDESRARSSLRYRLSTLHTPLATLHSPLILAGLLLGVCATTGAAEIEPPREGELAFQPGPDEAEVPEMYRLEAARFHWRQTPRDSLSKTYAMSEVTFPSPVETPHVNNNTVHCEYFEPLSPGKHPGVIVLHILGGDFDLSRLFCRQLAHDGAAALFVKLPYYGPRRQTDVKTRMISEDPRETAAGMRQAILDIRRGVAWLGEQPEVDPERLGVFGISLGGITGALALTIEPRLSYGCLMLAGGDVGRVAWDNPRLEKLRQRWLDQGKTKEEFFELLRSVDPVTYAKRVSGKRVLMLNAKHDEIIPRACTDSLWHALGEPEIVWYEAGHISAMRYLLDGLARVSRFCRAVPAADDTNEDDTNEDDTNEDDASEGAASQPAE